MIYLDNAATTFPKPRTVINSVNDCLNNYCGNPSRSSHILSMKASEAVYEAREAVAELVGINDPERVVFTMNATYALNLAIKTSIKSKCHVLISDIEHNSVVRTVEKLKSTLGVECSRFDTDNIEASITSLLRADTAAIISTLASNVTGKRVSLELLSVIAKKHGLILITDAAQLIGHEAVNLKKYPCNVLCAPGHKALFGIQGCGFAIFCDEILRDSFIEGGSGSNSASPGMPDLLPERFEAGTLPTPAIAALTAGIKFLREITEPAICEKLSVLNARARSVLDSIAGIKAYGTGPISFSYKNIPSSVICSLLDKRGICTRGGLHCAPHAHEKLGTLDGGLVRISTSILNSTKDLDELYYAIKDISRIY